MSLGPLVPVIACAALAGVTLTVVIAALLPARPDLRSALETLRPQDLGRPPVQVQARTDLTGRVGRSAQRLAGRWSVLRAPESDLELLERPVPEHYALKAMFAVGAWFAVTLVSLVAGFPLAITLIAALAVVPMAWFAPDAQVRTQAKARRADFSYAAVSYLRLVAIQRQSGLGVVTSLDTAAEVSGAWMFRRIAEEMRLARWSGTPAWDALARLAGRLGVSELQEVADIVRLSAAGAGITDNLMARATSMRDRLLNAERAEADSATTSMTLPLMLLVGLLLVTLMIPTGAALLR